MVGWWSSNRAAWPNLTNLGKGIIVSGMKKHRLCRVISYTNKPLPSMSKQIWHLDPMGVSSWINVSSWTRKKHSRSGLTINLKGSHRTLKKQSSIPMKQKSDDFNSSHQTKTFHQTSKMSHYAELQGDFIYIYVLNTVISWFFVCYINTFWCCLRSLRVLNSTFYQDTGQPSSDHGCCPDDSPCCWDPHTWTSRSVDEVRHPTWTPQNPPKKTGLEFSTWQNMYINMFLLIFLQRPKKPNINILQGWDSKKQKKTPTSNCWDPNNSKLGTQNFIEHEFFSWVLDHRP